MRKVRRKVSIKRILYCTGEKGATAVVLKVCGKEKTV
jgi:hypothetical protein